MGIKKYKMKTSAKILIFILIAAIVLPSVYFLTNKFSNNNKSSTDTNAITLNTPDKTNTSTKSDTLKEDVTINLALSEKISWKPILDANGGLTTKPGSIYDKLGIKVNIITDNDPNSSSDSFISNKVNSLGYSINGYAGLYKKFQDAKVETVLPYITDSSYGADGIIVKEGINSVNDFINRKIAVPDFSSDQTLILWLLLKSDLNQEQINKIKSNIVVYKSVNDTAKAFFDGKVDVAAVRQPFLTNAKNTSGDKILFTTKSANNLIFDGIIFRKDFADNHKDVITKFIDGALQALDVKGFDGIKSMKTFKDTKDDELNQMISELKYSDYSTNVSYLDGTAQKLFEDMSSVWEMVGKSVVHGVGDKAFSKAYLDSLNGKYTATTKITTKINDAQKQKAQSQGDEQALLNKSASINFQPNSANFNNVNEAASALDEFVNIAKFLDGAVIQIEGNVADVGKNDPEASKKLSEARANTVAKYLQDKGVDSSRFVVIGNGISKQVGDNNTPEGQTKNRRTDIFFKIIE